MDLEDAHVAFALILKCLIVCRIMYLMRNVALHLMIDTKTAFQTNMDACFRHFAGGTITRIRSSICGSP